MKDSKKEIEVTKHYEVFEEVTYSGCDTEIERKVCDGYTLKDELERPTLNFVKIVEYNQLYTQKEVDKIRLEERKRTLEEVLKLPKGEIITPTTIMGYKVIRVIDIEALLTKLTTK